MRRLVVVLVCVVAVVGGGWWARKTGAPVPPPAPAPAPWPQPLPEAPFEVMGRVLDAEGHAVEGAEVALFGDRETWVEPSNLFGTRKSDGARDCAHFSIACHSVKARAEALRQVDAGTLAFPEPLARTKTDAAGRFTLITRTRDAFVVAWKDSMLDLGRDELSPWGLVDLRLTTAAQEAVTLTPWTTALLVVNPFTREVQRAALGEAIGPPADESQIWFEEEGVPMRDVRLELQYDGGLVEGRIELDCGTDGEWTLETDGGVAFVHLPRRNRGSCTLEASTPDLWDHTYLLAEELADVVKLSPRRALTVRWSPVGALGPTRVTADYPIIHDPTGISGIGTRGGGGMPGSGVFDGGVASFDPLDLKPESGDVSVTIEQPGFARLVRKVLPVTGRTTELAVTLMPSPASTGVVVDASGRAVVGLVVDGEAVDGGEKAWALTDERGVFFLMTDDTGDFTLEARHPLLGAATVVTDGGPARLELRPTADVVLTLEGADGGVLSGLVVTLDSDDGSLPFSVRTSPRGEVSLPGLRPGERTLNVTREGAVGSATLKVPQAGSARARLRLP